jgi:hypothetical protein
MRSKEKKLRKKSRLSNLQNLFRKEVFFVREKSCELRYTKKIISISKVEIEHTFTQLFKIIYIADSPLIANTGRRKAYLLSAVRC